MVAAAAKAKKEKEGEKFHCPAVLLAWEKAGVLRKKLGDHNTAELKELCRESNLRYGGPKYELVARLLEHVEEAHKREKFAALQAQAEEGDVASSTELYFEKVKSFNAACNLFEKHKPSWEKSIKQFAAHGHHWQESWPVQWEVRREGNGRPEQGVGGLAGVPD